MGHLDPSRIGFRTEKISALPIINEYMEKLRIGEILSCRLASSSRLPVHSCLLVLLRNIVMERRPSYGIKEWAGEFVPSLLGVSHETMNMLNDDRMGRSLDLLYDADRGSMITEIAVRTVKTFGIGMDEFHNDSTTITFSGDYDDADGSKKRGKDSIHMTRGYNKDHRPDLKQILWTLTVSSDHSVPVHYNGHGRKHPGF